MSLGSSKIKTIACNSRNAKLGRKITLKLIQGHCASYLLDFLNLKLNKSNKSSFFVFSLFTKQILKLSNIAKLKTNCVLINWKVLILSRYKQVKKPCFFEFWPSIVNILICVHMLCSWSRIDLLFYQPWRLIKKIKQWCSLQISA